MFEALKDFELTKLLLWVVRGAFIALSRSFALRGSFPSITKDDIAVLILGSVIYDFILMLLAVGINPNLESRRDLFSPLLWFIVIVVIPVIIGFVLGLAEASDYIGRQLRKTGICLPSPDPSAWATMFHDLKPNTVLVLTLKDGTTVFGRWIGGEWGSASSTDTGILDLYLGEIGSIDNEGKYVPKQPRRGAYLAPGEVRFIEVISV